MTGNNLPVSYTKTNFTIASDKKIERTQMDYPSANHANCSPKLCRCLHGQSMLSNYMYIYSTYAQCIDVHTCTCICYLPCWAHQSAHLECPLILAPTSMPPMTDPYTHSTKPWDSHSIFKLSKWHKNAYFQQQVVFATCMTFLLWCLHPSYCTQHTRMYQQPWQ